MYWFSNFNKVGGLEKESFVYNSGAVISLPPVLIVICFISCMMQQYTLYSKYLIFKKNKIYEIFNIKHQKTPEVSGVRPLRGDKNLNIKHNAKHACPHGLAVASRQAFAYI